MDHGALECRFELAVADEVDTERDAAGRLAFGVGAGVDAMTGTLSVDGDAVLGGGATTAIDLAGETPGAGHDQLSVTGNATLGGRLEVTLASGYEPELGTVFDIVVADAIASAFNVLITPDDIGFAVDTMADRVRLTAATPCPGDLGGDRAVGLSDLIALLIVWGTPVADLNGDDDTGLADLLVVLSNWGVCD